MKSKRARKKQVEALEVLKPEKIQELETIQVLFPRNNEIKNELDEIKKWEEKIKRKDLIYGENKYKYGFQQYETIRSFDESINAGKIIVDEAEEGQSNLLKNIVQCNEKIQTKNKRR